MSYAYDALDRLASITQGARTVSFAYDAAGRRVSAAVSGGCLVTDYAYDAAGRLAGITHRRTSGAVIGTLLHEYGPAGDLRSRGGTLFQSVLPAPVEGAAYNAANRLISRVAGGVAAAPAWDAEARLLNDGQRSYQWDPRGRLLSVSGVGSFAYDAAGRRLSATVAGQTTHYVYDGWEVARELRPGGNPAPVDLLGGAGTDERFARHTLTFLTDHLGSTVALANPDGTIYNRYGYDPYGATSVSGTFSSNPFQFAGREQVGTTGLYHNRARYYRADWGRFVSEDPIGLAGGINLYGYATSNPIDFRDPTGQFAAPVVRFVMTMIGAVASSGGSGGGHDGTSSPSGPTPPKCRGWDSFDDAKKLLEKRVLGEVGII